MLVTDWFILAAVLVVVGVSLFGEMRRARVMARVCFRVERLERECGVEVQKLEGRVDFLEGALHEAIEEGKHSYVQQRVSR